MIKKEESRSTSTSSTSSFGSSSGKSDKSSEKSSKGSDKSSKGSDKSSKGSDKSSKDSERKEEEGSSSEESSAEESSNSDSSGSNEKTKKKKLIGDSQSNPAKAYNFTQDDDTSSGTTIHIGEGSIFWRSDGMLTIRFDSPQTIRLIDVTKCYVSEIHDKCVPNFKSPQLVTNINFDGTICQENFNSLMDQLVNLKYLGIHLSSLATLNFNCKSSFDLPNLENLNISGIGFTEDHARVSDMNAVVNNCNGILRCQFPKIIYLSISCPMVMCREQELTEAILNFLIRHKGSIKFLNLESLFKMGSAFYYGLEDPGDEDANFPPVQYDLSKIKGVKLGSFHLFHAYSTGSTELWRNFLLTQKDLDYCQFWCESKQYPFYPLSEDIARKNTATLHTFAFYFQRQDDKPIDCALFKTSNLTTLLLKGSCGNNTSVGISNFTSMPKSLCFVKILQLPMHKKDLSFIATKLPDLSRLYLEDVGEHKDFGLCLQDLGNLLQKKYSSGLQSIHLVRSINRDSFEEPAGNSSNNDGYRIMAKILLKSQRFAGFQAELNENGEFDIVQCDEEVDHMILDSDEVCPESERDEDSFDVLYQHGCDNNKISTNESSCESGGGPTQDECIQAEAIRPVECIEEGIQIGPGEIYQRTEDQCGQYLDGNTENYGYNPRYNDRTRGMEYCPNYSRSRPPIHQENQNSCIQAAAIRPVECIDEGIQIGPGEIYQRTENQCRQYLGGNTDDYGYSNPRYNDRTRGKEYCPNYSRSRPPIYQENQNSCIQAEAIRPVECIDEGVQIGSGEIYQRSEDQCGQHLDLNTENYGYNPRYTGRTRGKEYSPNYSRSRPPIPQENQNSCVPHTAPKVRKGFYCVEQEFDVLNFQERQLTVPCYYQKRRPHYKTQNCTLRHPNNKNKIKIPETIHEHSENKSENGHLPSEPPLPHELENRDEKSGRDGMANVISDTGSPTKCQP